MRTLLDAGADPNDNDSLYHAVEPRDPATLRVLLDHDIEVNGTNALGHALDYERLEPVPLLLEHGFDVNEGSGYGCIHHAVVRRRSPAFVRLLAAHGADLTRRDERGRTAYQYAVRLGLDDVARALVELGSPTELDSADEALAAIARGRGDVVGLELDDDTARTLIELATRDLDTLERVVDVVGPNFRASWGGGPSGTLLHQAAWLGQPLLVEALLRRGATVDERVETAYATPLGWTAVGSRYASRDPDDSFAALNPDYVGVARRLVGAGARIEQRFVEMAVGELREWLAGSPG